MSSWIPPPRPPIGATVSEPMSIHPQTADAHAFPARHATVVFQSGTPRASASSWCPTLGELGPGPAVTGVALVLVALAAVVIAWCLAPLYHGPPSLGHDPAGVRSLAAAGACTEPWPGPLPVLRAGCASPEAASAVR